jgi:hypothetical protein
VADFFKAENLSASCMVLFIVVVLYVALYIGGSVYVSVRDFGEYEQWQQSVDYTKSFSLHQAKPHFLTNRNLPYFMLPFGFVCLLVQIRILMNIRRVIGDYVD